MPAIALWIGLLMFAPAAAAQPERVSTSDDLGADVHDYIRQLDTGDWNDRIHAVHALEYMGLSGMPGLAVAMEDGDWQVRMTAAHAIGGSLGPDGLSLLKYMFKHETCPAVRLIALHWMGPEGPEGEESREIQWIYDASSRDVNKCGDQAGPSRVTWAKHKIKPPPTTQPVDSGSPAAQRPSATAKPRPPTKQLRYAELQTVLGNDWDTLPEPPGIPKRQHPAGSSPGLAEIDRPQPTVEFSKGNPGAKETLPELGPAPTHEVSVAPEFVAVTLPGRASAQTALAPRPSGPKESLMYIDVPSQRAAKPIEAQALLMKDAGGKIPYDALPALLAMLKHEDSDMRAKAADELGHIGAAAAPAVPELIQALDDESQRVRSSASLALGNIGPAARLATPRLISTLKDQNLDVRYNASLALSRIGTPEARKALKRYILEEAYRHIEQE